MTAEAQTDAPEATETRQRPVDSIKVGHGIEVATWQQQGPNGPFETMSVTRSYQDKDNQWQTQKLTNVSPDQLLAISNAAGSAYIESRRRQHDKGRGR